MKYTLTLRKLDVSTGGPLIVIFHEKDAAAFSIRRGDRVELACRRRKIIGVADISHSKTFVRRGTLYAFEESYTTLKAKSGDKVTVSHKQKPKSIFYIQKKLHGGVLSRDEIREIIQSILANELTDIEITYFVSACYANELSTQEIVDLTNAMIESGEKLTFTTRKPIVDKHCIGGVAANRTTALVVAIVAAAGYMFPKTSSRSITSPAGTSDTIEVLTNVCLSLKEMKRVLKKTNACLVWGGALELAPADDKIIRIEHPMSLDPVGQMIASILSKKKSVSATHVLIDIPLGKGAKIQTLQKARVLRSLFTLIGRKLNMKVHVEITDGSQPIGNGIGPALEARDILWTLQNDPRGSLLLRKKAIALSGKIFEMVGACRSGAGVQKASQLLDSGHAYAKFLDIMYAQGSKFKRISADTIPVGPFMYTVKSSRAGKVKHLDNAVLSRIARILGAPVEKSAGLYLHVHKSSYVRKNSGLYTMYAPTRAHLHSAKLYSRKTNGIIVK